jgi:hypothetical protein
MTRPNVTLHIDELALHGFSPADRHQIAAALRREMTRLIVAHGVPEAWNASPPILQGRQLAISHDARPRQVGAAIARSVYGSTPR